MTKTGIADGGVCTAFFMPSVKQVLAALERLYPLGIADRLWDNVGLLVDASVGRLEADVGRKVRVLLTIDLTQLVCDEAVAARLDLVVAYHPFIFRGLKLLTSADPQQRLLLRLVQAGVSVYSPHTAVDAAKGGVNDFLAEVAGAAAPTLVLQQSSAHGEGEGMGRLVHFDPPVLLQELVARTKLHLGLAHVQVAAAHGASETAASIRTLAVCAGLGSSVFKGVEADAYLTGEMLHHEVLHLKESGKSVVLTNHTNCERPYLARMKQLLEDADVEVAIAATDADPLYTV